MDKLKASTLIEVTVSLVIISSIMTIGLMTYVNIIQSDDLTRKTEASIRTHQIVNQLKTDKEYIDNQITENEIFYDITFIDYDKKKNLILLEISAISNQQKELYNYSEILINE